GMDLVLSGRTGREWHVPWGLEGRNGREKQAPAGSEPPAGATPSEAGGDERQARPHRGGAAGDDAVAIEIGEAEMGVARGNAGGGGGAQALDALAVKQMVEVHHGAPSMQAGARGGRDGRRSERGTAPPSLR